MTENPAENLSLPRRWKTLPKALSEAEIDQLLAPPDAATEPTPDELCDHAVVELAYASGLRLAELRTVRLEQLHLDAGFLSVIGKGSKERVVPMGRRAHLPRRHSPHRPAAPLPGADQVAPHVAAEGTGRISDPHRWPPQ